MRKNKNINASDFRHYLYKKFVPKQPVASKTNIVQHLYHRYHKTLTQPRMNIQNLIKATRYIKKHDLRQDQYNQAIKHTASTNSALTISDFSDMYDYIAKKENSNYKLSKSKIDLICKASIRFIMRIVNKGAKINFHRFGSFEGMMLRSKKYKIPNTNQSKLVKAHIMPKFRPSAKWKKSLRK